LHKYLTPEMLQIIHVLFIRTQNRVLIWDKANQTAWKHYSKYITASPNV